MKKKLIVIFLLIILIPLGLTTWLGMRNLDNEQEVNRRQFQEVLSKRLKDIDEKILTVFQTREIELIRMEIDTTRDIDDIRSILRRNRIIRHIFLLDSEGEKLYPREGDVLSISEKDFLIRTKDVRISRGLFLKPSIENTQVHASSGWYTWFMGDGINFIFYLFDDYGGIVGFEMDRMAMIADIIGILPETDISGREEPENRILLTDVNENVLYQWGGYQPKGGEEAFISMPLSSPLGAWKLKYYVDRNNRAASFTQGRNFFMVTSILVLFIAVTGLAVYFYRESTREMREAFRKVTFVNQASHELKTPLTNIRLYAELLKNQVSPEEEKANGYLNIIVSESRRLSRLINNVLTFSKSQKSGIKLHLKSSRVDDVIDRVLENFGQVLEVKGIEVDFKPSTGEKVLIDEDILEQIISNLISNVEKYAACGKQLIIVSRQEECRTTVRVSDKGPGIPWHNREKIFVPFFRLSNKLSDGVTGTGIGLAIARDLAIRHGGSLTLEQSDKGAAFCLVLKTEKEER